MRELKMKTGADSKDLVQRDRVLILEDEKGRKTSFFPFLSQLNFYFEPFLNSYRPNSNELEEVISSTAFLNLDLNQDLNKYPIWPDQLDKIKKVTSAKRMLRDLSQHYESIFKGHDRHVKENNSEKQAFLNSNLLYLIAATDGYEDTAGHSQLVASYTLMLTKAMGIKDKNYLVNIERGALLHDIGKIGIPESILRKPGVLTPIEREIIKDHPLIGYELIEEFEFLRKSAQVVLYHHESYDGSGYPYGLAGGDIPLEARIFSLADTLDAITSDRPYREAKSFEQAFREIEKGSGSQFDPSVVDAFFSVPKEKWGKIKQETEESFRFYTVH